MNFKSLLTSLNTVEVNGDKKFIKDRGGARGGARAETGAEPEWSQGCGHC